MTWEVFKGRGRANRQSMWVSVGPGHFTLGHMAYEALGAPVGVELLFAPGSRQIAFRAAEATNSNGYKIGRNGKAHTVSNTRFVRHYGIDTTVTRRYAATMRDSLLIVDLNGDSVIVTSNRRTATVDDDADATNYEDQL